MHFFTILKTLIKSLLRKPATVKFPFGPREYCDGARGKIAIIIGQCIFCGICQRKCPTGAIVVERTRKNWTIDRLRCIACNACVEACPKKCLNMDKNYSTPCADRKPESYNA